MARTAISKRAVASRVVAEPLAATDWSDRPVTVMGLGRHGGGVAAARFLASRGARVTISDLADRAALSDSIALLRDVPIVAFKLGRHDSADFHTDFVVVNPAVRPGHPCLRIARDCGARLISETELFLEVCPAAIVGVTGSNGKSTTCAMLYDIFLAAGKRAWLGGNIGHSLLGELDQIKSDDWVVLELSSFQLSHLNPGTRLPEIAVVTNFSPNHLDWHPDLADYRRAKQRILRANRAVVFNGRDAEVASWSTLARGTAKSSWPLERIGPLAVPGKHNRQNAACAAAAAEVVGIAESTIVASLALFQGLRHRLQQVATVGGRRFYNDSKSTTPQATIAAIAAIDRPVWLLAGGHPKVDDFEAMASAIVQRAQGAAVYGAVRERLRAAIERQSSDFKLFVTEHLGDAVDWCWSNSCTGDAILLSPGCASHDQYRDYQQRGDVFCALVGRLASTWPVR